MCVSTCANMHGVTVKIGFHEIYQLEYPVERELFGLHGGEIL
jgi:hypothetical protein